MVYGQKPKYYEQWLFGLEVPNRNVSTDQQIKCSKATLTLQNMLKLHNGRPLPSNEEGEELVGSLSES